MAVPCYMESKVTYFNESGVNLQNRVSFDTIEIISIFFVIHMKRGLNRNQSSPHIDTKRKYSPVTSQLPI